MGKLVHSSSHQDVWGFCVLQVWCVFVKNICASTREISSWTIEERSSPYLHILCIYSSNPQIVIALLFGCSVACRNGTLHSRRRVDCRRQNQPKYGKLDAYIQIRCHGNGQSCYATCDGATSSNSNTGKSVRVRTRQSKPARQLFPILP